MNPGTTSTGWRYVRRTCREPKICCPAEVVACRGPDELAGHRVRLVNRAGPVVKHRLNQVLECQWEPSSIARQHGEAGRAPTSGAFPGNPDSRHLSISAWEKRKLALHSNDRADRETRFGPTRRRGGDARTGGQDDSESRVILLRLVIDPALGGDVRPRASGHPLRQFRRGNRCAIFVLAPDDPTDIIFACGPDKASIAQMAFEQPH